MKKNFLILLFIITAIPGYTQLPQDVYRKPLKEVLTEIDLHNKKLY